MDLQTVILGFLNDGPLTGYELSKRMDASVGFYWHATHPQIYTTLKSLAKKGLVDFTMEYQSGAPNKKIYSITDAGRDALFRNLQSETLKDEVKIPLLVAMYFGGELGPQYWRELLANHLDAQKAVLEQYRSLCESLPQTDPDRDLKQFLRYKTLDFGIGYQQFLIRWLEDILKEIGE
ncbi:MAG: PadR family transcriptional regulator [FCB group bacterium]|nr:PadR family transcriptional regulator [FCB group bacterium]